MGIKYRVNENFFDAWTPVMAYVLGYMYADGSLEDASYIRGKYIRVSSVEKYSILRIKRWLGSKHTIVEQKSAWKNGRTKYLLRIGSHKLYTKLVSFGLYPNKSLTIQFPEIPKNYLHHFVRGYLDGDGCVYFYRARGKTRKLITKKLSVIFTSGSRIFLEKLNAVLKTRIDLKQEKVYRGQRAYQLRYGTSDSVQLFSFLYRHVPRHLYFTRKTKPFLLYFKLHPAKMNQRVENTLYKLRGHVVKKQTRRSAKPLFAGANPAVASTFEGEWRNRQTLAA